MTSNLNGLDFLQRPTVVEEELALDAFMAAGGFEEFCRELAAAEAAIEAKKAAEMFDE